MNRIILPIYLIYHRILSSWLYIRILLSYLWAIYLIRILEIPISQERMAKKHLRNARRYRWVAMRLRGGMIKIAQFLSTQKEMVPKEVVAIFEAFQDRVAPVPVNQVKKIIYQMLQQDVENIFASFDPVPLATASFGQVHRATLLTGEDVVIKVQHRHIKKLLTIDLNMAARFIKLLSFLMGRHHLIPAYREIQEALLAELDYIQEAKFAKQFQNNFKDDPTVYIPEIFDQYTTKQTLVSRFIDGYKITDRIGMKKLGYTPKDLLEQVFNAYFKQFYEDGFFHSDPHPGNLFFMKGPTIAFVDFGQSKQFPESIKRGLQHVVRGMLSGDFDLVTSHMIEMNFIDPKDREILIQLLDNILGKIKTGSACEVGGLTLDFQFIKNEIFDLVHRMDIQFPDGVVLYGRTLVYLHGLASDLDPELDIFQMARDYLCSHLF